MSRTLRVAWLSFRLGVLNALQYRVDFGIQLVQSAIGLTVALGGIAVVFGQTDDLAGWSREELVTLIGVFMFVRGLIDVVIRPSMERLMEGVRLGTLDYALTKPVDAQVLVSIRQVEVWRLVDVTVGALVIVAGVVGLGAEVGVERAAAFGLVLVAGLAILYSFLLILATLSFWLVRLENILVIFITMYEAGRWPVGIYPPFLRITLTFVVPVAFAITVPVQTLVGRLDPATLGVTVAVAAGFLVASRVFWRFGLRHYTGASA